ncbi:MAG: hypothetical protein J07HX64_00391 [halophilic archaeon J07HX64]|jgi:hypothetical protein|nr:MAG: hypothetical protein J07HX64_00391 [halophilic archaeon J07HX64]
MRGRLLAELGVERFATRLAQTADTDDSTDADGSTDTDDSTDHKSRGVSTTDPEPDGTTETGPAGDSAEGDDDSTTPSTGGVSLGGGGGDPLAAVNQMLREHDDKWREGSDEPYEVDLPDGRTESARTKDDVRQLLFRHYTS